MKLVKQSLRSNMLDIYECPKCHKEEYYGMLRFYKNKSVGQKLIKDGIKRKLNKIFT